MGFKGFKKLHKRECVIHISYEISDAHLPTFYTGRPTKMRTFTDVVRRVSPYSFVRTCHQAQVSKAKVLTHKTYELLGKKGA